MYVVCSRDVMLMLKSSVERRIRMFVVRLRMLHVYLVSLLRVLSSFWMYDLEKGTA